MIDALTKATSTPTWQILHALADAAVPELRAAFLQAVAETVNATTLSEVTAALARGDLAAAEAAIPWDTVGAEVLRAALPPALSGLATEAAAIAAPSVSLTVSFDLVNPRAVAWAEAHAADLVTQITTDTQAAIRAVIVRATSDGLAPRDAAREIHALVGLTERDATAVQNFRATLEGQDRAAAQIDRMTQRYSDRLLSQRSENIARTETMGAASEGQRVLWESAREQGLTSGSERAWIITRDDRICPLCSVMKGKRAPIGGTYQHPTLGAVSGPILHPSCRCAEKLVEVT